MVILKTNLKLLSCIEGFAVLTLHVYAAYFMLAVCVCIICDLNSDIHSPSSKDLCKHSFSLMNA